MAKRYEIEGADGRRIVDEDDDRILRDGEKLRVPLMFRDAALSPMQKAVADATVGVDMRACAHQPGPCRVVDQAALDAKEAAYRQMCVDLQVAWQKSSAPTAAAVPQPVEVRDARPPIPVTDADFARLRQIRDESYRAMVAEMESAWRRPAR